MKTRLLLVLVLTALMLLAAVAPALAQAPVPGGGPEFGQMVSGMTPHCPIHHGVMFGQCVSAMARGLPCPCPHGM